MDCKECERLQNALAETERMWREERSKRIEAEEKLREQVDGSGEG
jgi:hypothetical protein